MINLEQTRRSMDDTVAEIARERAAHSGVIDAFHRVFYASQQTHGMSFYEGVPVLQNPLDLWVLQEIVWDLRPTLVVETGTAYGGLALYLARQLDRLGEGVVVSVDLEANEKLPRHPRVSYVPGSSTRVDIVDAIAAVARTHPRVMVLLDSDHGTRHVMDELDAYAELVTPGQVLVVADTNINGRPVPLDWQGEPGNGPGPAVDAWLPAHPEFERAALAERYLVTFHTWLRRIWQ